ncbi:MAG: TIGR03560 family F420-dependent LLM class oxidoreductase [Candidatus Nanopelagicales bacterium]
MRFSVWPDLSRPWAEVAAMADYAEASGWDGLYVYDHFMPHTPDDSVIDGPVLEGWTVLSALATRTSRLRLGTMVLGNLYRHPAVLASMAATLDHVCDGRLVLGIGAGWQANEHAAYGIPLPPPKERLDRLEEACEVLTALLGPGRTTFDGDHYRLADAVNEPKPVQDKIPLLVGGRGEKRTMRIAARWADEWNAWTSPETARHKAKVLDQHCADLGRDPATIVRSTQAVLHLDTDPARLPRDLDPHDRIPHVVGTPDRVAKIMAEYRDAGVDEFLVPDDAEIPWDQARDTLELFRAEVIPQLR